MMFINLFFKIAGDAMLLALGIAVVHFIIIGSAVGASGFVDILLVSFVFAIINIGIRMLEIHKTLKNRE